MRKRGQATVFVILVLVIMAIIGLVVFFTQGTLNISPSTHGEDVKESFEECIKEKISYGVADANFRVQPHITLAKAYLKAYLKANIHSCISTESLKFEHFKITHDTSKLDVKVDFPGAIDHNSIETIKVEVILPTTIQKGNKKEILNQYGVTTA